MLRNGLLSNANLTFVVTTWEEFLEMDPGVIAHIWNECRLILVAKNLWEPKIGTVIIAEILGLKYRSEISARLATQRRFQEPSSCFNSSMLQIVRYCFTDHFWQLYVDGFLFGVSEKCLSWICYSACLFFCMYVWSPRDPRIIV